MNFTPHNESSNCGTATSRSAIAGAAIVPGVSSLNCGALSGRAALLANDAFNLRVQGYTTAQVLEILNQPTGTDMSQYSDEHETDADANRAENAAIGPDTSTTSAAPPANDTSADYFRNAFVESDYAAGTVHVGANAETASTFNVGDLPENVLRHLATQALANNLRSARDPAAKFANLVAGVITVRQPAQIKPLTELQTALAKAKANEAVAAIAEEYKATDRRLMPAERGRLHAEQLALAEEQVRKLTGKQRQAGQAILVRRATGVDEPISPLFAGIAA